MHSLNTCQPQFLHTEATALLRELYTSEAIYQLGKG